MQGKFVMIDGLDGSGKSTIVQGLKEQYRKTKKVFDLKEYWEQIHQIPDVKEIMEYDVIMSYEPTFSWIGKAIREELIRNSERKYSSLSIAHAFALDREILYRKLIIPALHAKKTVIQERGVVSSLVYQPLQHDKITLRDILHLPGNNLALKHPPHMIIIIDVDAEVVIDRLGMRTKKDDAIFETLEFQRKLQSRYKSEWLQKAFSKSKIVTLDTNPPKTESDSIQGALRLIESIQ